MSQERRGAERWPVAVTARVTLQNGQFMDSNILNVNLGGCFLEGVFGLGEGDVVLVHSYYNPKLNGIYCQILWVVDEPGLKGIGVRFQPMDDTQKFDLIKWFNQVVGR
jgi:PilZ domain